MIIPSTVNKVIYSAPIWLIYVIGLIPALILLYGGYNNRLGPDPLKVLEHELGEYALVFLIVVLSFRPLKKLFKINLVRFRRSFGLLSFWYAVLHVLTYLILDQQLMLDLIINDLTKRPYIIIGFFAFLILIPLALTSNNFSVRWLGSKKWRNLHLLVYLAALLAATHYLMLVKSWPIKPIIYLLIVVILIVFRWGSQYFFVRVSSVFGIFKN